MNKKQIIAEIKKICNRLNNKKIVAVYLFGSVVNGNVTVLSDIDICILGKNLKFDEMAKIHGEFSEDYDVSFFDEMPIWIKMRVLKGIPVIVNNSEKLYNISFRALAEYEDFKYLINKRVVQRFEKCMI